MFTYNVKRRWFTRQEDANKFRVAEGLPPKALRVLRIDDREALAALLNALCEPATAPAALAAAFHSEPITKALLDDAYVQTGKDIPDCVPDFLLKDYGLKRE